MKRRLVICATGASALLAAVGLNSAARADFSLGPTSVLTYSTNPANPGIPNWNGWLVSTNNTTYSNVPVIDQNGRVYFLGGYTTSPAIGTLANNRGIFTATSSADLAPLSTLYENAAAPGTAGQSLGVSTLSTNGLNNLNSSTSLRLGGTEVLVGAQVYGTGINESGNSQNNSYLFSGSNAGGVSTALQRNDTVTIPGVGTGTTINNYKTQANTLDAITSTGLIATPVQMNSTAPGSPFITGTGLTANDTALAVNSSGTYTVVANCGEQPGGAGTPQFAEGGNGVGGSYVKFNGNGQLYYDAKYNTTAGNPGGVVSNTASTLWSYNPTTQVNTRLVGMGDTAATTGNGTAVYTGSGFITNQHGVSNAGILFSSPLSGGDTNLTTTAFGPANGSGLYISSPTSGVQLVERQGDAVPGIPGALFGSWSGTTNCQINNSGSIVFNNTLVNAFGSSAITSSIASTIWTGLPGSLQLVAQGGMTAPGLHTNGKLTSFATASGIAFNNNGAMVFGGSFSSSDTYPGFNGNALYAWTPQTGLIELLYSYYNASATVVSSQVQVAPGVYKNITLGGWSFATQDNGNGGSAALDDNNELVLSLSFTDGSFGVVKFAIPTPGSGAIAMLGLGVMARRRRRTA